MKVQVQGKLVDAVITKSADGSKNYYSLMVYSQGKTDRVGVPEDCFNHYSEYLNEEIELNDVNLWIEGKHSLYIKG